MLPVLLVCSLWAFCIDARTLGKRDGDLAEQRQQPQFGNLVTAIMSDSTPAPPCPPCNKKYFLHYAVKGCSPVYNPGCDCPVRFECSPQNISNSTCVYKNQTYELGESVPTSNPCRLCSCRQDFSTGLPSLSCISKECPHNFRPYPPGCYGIYVPERCCPVRTQCKNSSEEISDDGEEEAVATCELDGQTYQLGQKMYPRDSECQTCICTEDWDPVNRTGCSVVECLLETQLHYLRRGCVPVYHDKVCCPIDYHCPVSEMRALDDSPTHNDSTKHGDDEEDEEDDDKSKPDLCVLPSVSGPCYALFTRFYFDTTLGRCSEFTYGGCRGNPNNFLTKERCEAVCQPGRRKKSLAPEHPENMCLFDRRYYAVGHILEGSNQTSYCVTCTCLTPPDFTCVHQSCSPPPNNDYVNCVPSYIPGECCPTYNCSHLLSVLVNDTTREGRALNTSVSSCEDLKCRDDQACMMTRKRCGQSPCVAPSCYGLNTNCTIPVCNQECTLEGFSDEQCPICQCPAEGT